MTIDQRLDEHLHATTSQLDLPGLGATVVMARGQRARRRTMAARGGAGLALALVATAVVVRNTGDDGQLVTADDPTVDTTPRTEGPLTWRSVAPSSALGWAQSLVTTSDGTTYAMSTTPGRATGEEGSPRAFYRSTDGVEWQVVNFDLPMAVTSLAASGEQLYAVGTAPANSGDERRDRLGVPTVASSVDGGSTFVTRELPVDIDALIAATGGSSLMVNDVATVGNRTVAAVSSYSLLDPSAFTTEDVSWGWAATDQGLVVFGPPDAAAVAQAQADICGGRSIEQLAEPNSYGGRFRCAGDPAQGIDAFDLDPSAIMGVPGQTLSWASLGVDAATATLLHGAPQLFVAEGDGPFERVDTPAEMTAGASVSIDLQSVGERIVAVTSTWDPVRSEASGAMWTSPDGASWAPAIGDVDLSWVTTAGVLDGSLVLVGQAQDWSGWWAYRSTDGVNWTKQDLTSLLPTELAAQAGGTYLEASASADGMVAVALAVPDGRWAEAPLDSAVTVPEDQFVDTTAEVLDGEGLVIDEAVPTEAVPTYQRVLLTTTDGASWSLTDLDKLTDVRIAQVLNLSISQGRINVGLALSTRNRPDGLQDRITLVGERS